MTPVMKSSWPLSPHRCLTTWLKGIMTYLHISLSMHEPDMSIIMQPILQTFHVSDVSHTLWGGCDDDLMTRIQVVKDWCARWNNSYKEQTNINNNRTGTEWFIPFYIKEKKEVLFCTCNKKGKVSGREKEEKRRKNIQEETCWRCKNIVVINIYTFYRKKCIYILKGACTEAVKQSEITCDNDTQIVRKSTRYTITLRLGEVKGWGRSTEPFVHTCCACDQVELLLSYRRRQWYLRTSMSEAISCFLGIPGLWTTW